MDQLQQTQMRAGIHGLQMGIVMQLTDPQNEFRVLVSIPALDNKSVWAKLSNSFSGAHAGAFVYPEIGDEVFLAFINNNPGDPVIIGSCYSVLKPPPFLPDDSNNTKAYVSRGLVKVAIDESNKSITIATPAGNSITISDADNVISMTDVNNNSIVLNAEGITIKSGKNLTITSQEDIKISGLHILNEAQIDFSAKAGVAAEISGSAQTSVKGGIVMIN